MPELNGLEVLKCIRQHHSAIALPVIMVTSKFEGADVAEALAAGANDYVTKPIDFVVVLARTNTQLALKRANKSLEEANKNLERHVAERTAELTQANEQLRVEMIARERSQAEAYYPAHHDPLTGLGNRTFFQQHLSQVLARTQRTGHSVAILFIDLDGFKSINDTLGHSIGDALLQIVARRLRDGLHDTDEVARLGGDEFAVIRVGDEQPKGAADLAALLLQIVSTPCEAEGHQLQVGASIGIALTSQDKLQAEQLLKNADLAMYRAKAEGRGRYRFFEPEMDKDAQARRALENELRAAVANNGFEVHYQPLVDLRKKCVSSLEALLRWRKANGECVPPSTFIPLAEELGFIVPLGAWILRQACTDALKWPEDVMISVNVSSVHFRNGGLLRTVFDALETSGLPPRRLELEITELVLLENSIDNLAILDELHKHGIRIALDDFGTGYSSLSYLRRFHFDKIKVDQSFIRDLGHLPTISIVRAIADIGSSFGMTTTAEGVETTEQLNLLKGHGYTEYKDI